MAETNKKDKITTGLIAAQALISLIIVIISLFSIKSQELLIEFRFNFLQGFVEKTEWYVLYAPALTSLSILAANILIINRSKGKTSPMVTYLYMSGSVLVNVLTLVVVISMQAAIGL